MRLSAPNASRWITVCATAVVIIGGGVSALAASAVGSAHPHRVQPPVTRAPLNAAADSGDQLTLDRPTPVPPTTPVSVTIADHATFGNAPPPATSTVSLPAGHWATVVLDITGTETGRQFDRLLTVDDGQTQIFIGVTPEPTPTGITWHVTKDITGYLPLLSGTQTFSTFVDNFLSSIDTGIPVITAKLLFYPPGGGFRPAMAAGPDHPALAGDAMNETGPASAATAPGVPTQVVPIVPAGDSTDFNTINTGQTLTGTVTLPHNVTTATLDLYAVGQIGDEFWWSLSPSFREIEVTVDGKPAGVVWPFPYVYTGGVNPLIWRPLTGLHTMDIPSYRLDLTPFAGMLGGTHTIGLTVVNNAGFWLAGGSLLLTAGGPAVSGAVTSDTLSFPSGSSVSSSPALGSADQPVLSESANASYQISGTLTQGGRTWTDTLNQSLQFGNEQSNINPSCSGPCYQWVHGEMTSAASETITGLGRAVNRQDRSSYTVEAPNGFLTSGNDFFLPATVTQQLTDMASEGALHSSLSESIIGYGALEEDNSIASIAHGATTGTITDQDSSGLFQRTVVTRGGSVVQDLTSGS